MVGVLVASGLIGTVIWLGLGATGQLDQGRAYATPMVVALVGLVAAIAACITAVISPRKWALFASRRPEAVATLVLVTMLAVGFLYCDLWSLDQGDTWWEDSDKGWVLGWVTHFAVVGGLLLLLWWRRARSVTLLFAPVLTGILAFWVVPPAGWVDEKSDFSDASTIADGFNDVFPHTLIAGFGMVAVVLISWLTSRDAAVHGQGTPKASS